MNQTLLDRAVAALTDATAQGRMTWQETDVSGTWVAIVGARTLTLRIDPARVATTVLEVRSDDPPRIFSFQSSDHDYFADLSHAVQFVRSDEALEQLLTPILETLVNA